MSKVRISYITVGKKGRQYNAKAIYVKTLPTTVFNDAVEVLKKKFEGIDVAELKKKADKIVVRKRVTPDQVIVEGRKITKVLNFDKKAFKSFIRVCRDNNCEPDINKIITNPHMSDANVKWAIKTVFDIYGRPLAQTYTPGEEIRYIPLRPSMVLKSEDRV